ncbi:MAG: HAD hydrolase-like protein [Clostridia bacterium]|nr:HAD hydrolase-like protein [Clostridia bacterium]
MSMITLSEFKKTKDFLVCVDSDGCAMDTMDIKHIRCFGPCMVDVWSLQKYEKEILSRWNEINLYTLTRGINRFKGLSMALAEISEQYQAIDGIADLIFWSENADELSNDALKKEIENHPEKEIFKLDLKWSEMVNNSIKRLPESEIKPFPLVKDALKLAHEKADIAIVSSANLGAVLDEWEKHSLLEHTDIVLTQNVGSKAFCISELLKKGYKKENVLMCGDAPGDLKAAETNDVFYYPILVKNEKESWQDFINQGFLHLLSGSYKEYETVKKRDFYKNLGAE